jgi:hypothetical protein
MHHFGLDQIPAQRGRSPPSGPETLTVWTSALQQCPQVILQQVLVRVEPMSRRPPQQQNRPESSIVARRPPRLT